MDIFWTFLEVKGHFCKKEKLIKKVKKKRKNEKTKK